MPYHTGKGAHGGMKKKGGVYALMQGNYKPHKGAVKKAKFRVQKQHRS